MRHSYLFKRDKPRRSGEASARLLLTDTATRASSLRLDMSPEPNPGSPRANDRQHLLNIQ